MKTMKTNELRAMTPSELQTLILTHRRDQAGLRIKVAAVEGEKIETHRIKLLRREIARIKTVLRDRVVSGVVKEKGGDAS